MDRRVTRTRKGVSGKKLEEILLIWRKNVLIVVIVGRIPHLKSNFEEVPGKITGDILPARPFFLALLVNVYRSALIPIKLPCPKKFLARAWWIQFK